MSKESYKTLSEAMLEFQRQLKPIEKLNTVKYNGKTQFSYADLATIQQAIFPILSEVGLECYFSLKTLENEKIKLTCTLTHSASQEMRITELIIGQKIEDNPQKFGGLITYAKRYLLSSILNIIICDEIDVDAMAPDIWANTKSKYNVEVDRVQRNSRPAQPAPPARQPAQQPARQAQKPVMKIQEIKPKEITKEQKDTFIKEIKEKINNTFLSQDFTALLHEIKQRAKNLEIADEIKTSLIKELHERATKAFNYKYKKDTESYEAVLEDKAEIEF
ncbi:MAG: ERF family protein [Bacteroidetes bacterium]|nr:ERF family protein [Bacteroidota bacterium]